jgi:hypothetical protein
VCLNKISSRNSAAASCRLAYVDVFDSAADILHCNIEQVHKRRISYFFNLMPSTSAMPQVGSTQHVSASVVSVVKYRCCCTFFFCFLELLHGHVLRICRSSQRITATTPGRECTIIHSVLVLSVPSFKFISVFHRSKSFSPFFGRAAPLYLGAFDSNQFGRRNTYVPLFVGVDFCVNITSPARALSFCLPFILSALFMKLMKSSYYNKNSSRARLTFHCPIAIASILSSCSMLTILINNVPEAKKQSHEF